MGKPRETTYSLLVVACFSRHTEALDWVASHLTPKFGPVALHSPDFPFHHTKYYAADMGVGLVKRFCAFERLVDAGCLPEVKRFTIGLEEELARTGAFPEVRPINIDPGLIQLGKFLLASTKDQAHRVYLRDDIFAEVTLRFEAGAFEVWPWTYADYREPSVRDFLGSVRAHLYKRVIDIREEGKQG